MANRRKLFPTVMAAALMALFLPLMASAQGGYDPWGRDRRDRDRDYRRDRDYGRYDNRAVRDVARRLEDRSRDFQRHLDSSLDHSRYDGTRREDRINEMAKDFRNAAGDLRSRVGDGRNFDRGSGEARRLLQIAARIDRFIGRQRLDYRTESDWSQIRQDLRVLANIYGLSYNGGGYYGRDNRDNNPWWRRLP